MRTLLLVALFFVFFISLQSCNSPGTKAAKQMNECIENAIDNSNTIEEAGQMIVDCSKNIRQKYKSNMKDKDFQKDFEEKSKSFEEDLNKRALEKFGMKLIDN